AAGQAIWNGHIFTNGLTYMGWKVRRIYHGRWGLAPFQSLYEPPLNPIESFPMMPEWYFVILALGALSFLGNLWRPLAWALPAFVASILVTLIQSGRCALGAGFRQHGFGLVARRVVTGVLYLLQPLARLTGRLRLGLTWWRRRAPTGYTWPRPWLANIWTKSCPTVEERIRSVETALRDCGWPAVHGGDFDHWVLEVNGGILGSAR